MVSRNDNSFIELAKGLYKHSIEFYPPVKFEGKEWHPYPGNETSKEVAESYQKNFKDAGFKTRIMPVTRIGAGRGKYMLLVRRN